MAATNTSSTSYLPQQQLQQPKRSKQEDAKVLLQVEEWGGLPLWEDLQAALQDKDALARLQQSPALPLLALAGTRVASSPASSTPRASNNLGAAAAGGGGFQLQQLDPWWPRPVDRERWANQCCLCISPEGGLMAVAHGQRLLLLSLSHSSGEPTGLRTIEAACAKEGRTTSGGASGGAGAPVELITSLQFIPLVEARQRKRMCLAVAYSTGRLSIFDEKGILLLTQQLHLSPVLSMRLWNSGPPKGSDAPQELLSVAHKGGVLVSIDGFSLHSALRACLLFAEKQQEAPHATLDYNKWALEGQHGTMDAVACCTQRASFFLGEAELSEEISESSTMASKLSILAVGQDPTLAFYTPSYKQQFSFTTAISLASSMATRLTSAMFSFARTWWGATPVGPEGDYHENFSNSSIEAPIPLKPTSTFIDPKRWGTSISIDPTGCYGVVTDNLGRVLVVDVAQQHIVRMWKGYRDAQCCWLSSPSPSSNRQTQAQAGKVYLAIYGGKRGLLEVWPMLYGHRIGAMEVGSGGRLLPTSSSSSSCFLVLPQQHKLLRIMV
ncbi:Rab3 GTPase-activating protein non-catalytic subunit [Balamuthia mandrillaris]